MNHIWKPKLNHLYQTEISFKLAPINHAFLLFVFLLTSCKLFVSSRWWFPKLLKKKEKKFTECAKKIVSAKLLNKHAMMELILCRFNFCPWYYNPDLLSPATLGENQIYDPLVWSWDNYCIWKYFIFMRLRLHFWIENAGNSIPFSPQMPLFLKNNRIYHALLH